MEVALSSLLGLVLGGLIVFFVKKAQDEASKKSARAESERIINKAKAEAQKLIETQKIELKTLKLERGRMLSLISKNKRAP